jgi:RNA 2',3'-cyclic 3'-phosphodiesterase
MRTCRLFFALWPEPAQQVALSQATRHEVERSGGQAVPPQNFHITLVFVGSVPQSDVDRIGSIASRVAQEVGPEPVEIALDLFEHWKKPRIVCLTTQRPASDRASRMAELLRNRLTAAGLAPDPRPLRPHITLARKVSHGGTMEMVPPVHWTFREFALIESETGPAGSVYRCRARFPFGGLKGEPPTRC